MTKEHPETLDMFKPMKVDTQPLMVEWKTHEDIRKEFSFPHTECRYLQIKGVPEKMDIDPNTSFSRITLDRYGVLVKDEDGDLKTWVMHAYVANQLSKIYRHFEDRKLSEERAQHWIIRKLFAKVHTVRLRLSKVYRKKWTSGVYLLRDKIVRVTKVSYDKSPYIKFEVDVEE